MDHARVAEPRLRAVVAEEWQHSAEGEPRRRAFEPGGSAVAAVGPVAGVAADPGLHGVARDIEDRGDEMQLALHVECEEPVLEEMADAPVSAIRAAGVIPVDRLESGGEAALRRLHDEVVMRAHDAPRKHVPAVLRRRPCELAAERRDVLVVPHDATAIVPARDRVVDDGGIFVAVGTTHRATVPGTELARALSPKMSGFRDE